MLSEKWIRHRCDLLCYGVSADLLHTHLPRRFWWFLTNDFATMPSIIERLAAPIYWLRLVFTCFKSLYRWLVKREGNPGKDIVVVTTALCWYVGIVGLQLGLRVHSDHVVIHGVPYFALIYWYSRARMKRNSWSRRLSNFRSRPRSSS